MKATIYEADWQLLRINCLAARNDDGGWSTMVGTEGNLELLYRYLHEAEYHSVERQVRSYRMNNALNAVHMGGRGRGLEVLIINRIVNFKEVNVPLGSWNVDDVNTVAARWNWPAQTEKLKLWNRNDLTFLHADLRRRAQKGSERTRPELHKYLHCVRKALSYK